MQPYTTEFTLSREYLAECYDETLPHSKNTRPQFVLPMAASAVGLFLFFFVEQGRLPGAVFLALAALELIHIKYKRSWWILRQLWGKTGNSQVSLTVDETGIQTTSQNLETKLNWGDIKWVIETDLGLILVNQAGQQQYLSKALFSEALVQKILSINDEAH